MSVTDDPRPACLQEMTDELASVMEKYFRIAELEGVPDRAVRMALVGHGLAVLAASVDAGEEKIAREVLDELLAERGRK